MLLYIYQSCYLKYLENIEFIILLFICGKGLEFAQKHDKSKILNAKPGIFYI